MRFHVWMVGALLLLREAFDDDSMLTRSLLLNMFTQYLRDDKNNALSIMLSGSIQLFSFHFNTNHATFLKQCFEPFFFFFNDQCNTIRISIHFIYIHLQFINHSKYALSYAITHSKLKSCILQIFLSFFS